MQLVPSLKWQYFISDDGVHSEYPGNAFQWFENCQDANNIRHRYVEVKKCESSQILFSKITLKFMSPSTVVGKF